MIESYTLFWVVLAVVAIFNGAMREFTYGRKLTELRAHQLSTLTGMVLSGAAVWLFARFFPIDSMGVAFAIGLIWLFMTIAFEFIFGRLAGGHSWKKLLADYNLLAGRIWPIFLVWILLLPWIVYRLDSTSQ